MVSAPQYYEIPRNGVNFNFVWELRKGIAYERGWTDIDPVTRFGFIRDWKAVFPPHHEMEGFRWRNPMSLANGGLYHCLIPDYTYTPEPLDEAYDYIFARKSIDFLEFRDLSNQIYAYKLQARHLLWSTFIAECWALLVLTGRMDPPWFVEPCEFGGEGEFEMWSDDEYTQRIQVSGKNLYPA